MRTNHIKVRIDKTQHSSKCRLCSDRDETISHIISECSKLAKKKYKARHDWVGKVIHWEMCMKFKFDHTNEWYMHNPAPVLENDAHKLLWDFNIQNGSPNPGQKTRPYNHHNVVPLARISLTLSRHFSLSLIASGGSSGLHPVSSHSCCMYVRAGRPAFAWPYARSIGVHHLWARPCFSSSVLHVWFV